ncbi:hypothetical protein JCM1841_004065 [Sporobolomyces salmonicolor]
MPTKETLRLLSQLFASSSATTNPFIDLTLPKEVHALLDSHLRTFASSFPLTSAGGSAGQSEGERERARWREGLLEIWALVEPLPGTESEALPKVSAFLVLLHKLSADVGDDDDSALISRKDIGAVWWGAVLRRTMLGTAKEDETGALDRDKHTRGRKPNRKGKEPAAPASSGSTMRPLHVSRQALTAAAKTVVWGMAPRQDQADQAEDYVSPFGLVILNEYEDRALARLKGLDEGYGVKNLEECVISWGEKSPKAFFLRTAPFITPTAPSRLPSLSIVLAYLSRHSAKAYHALGTPLISNLITISLLSPCPAIVTLAIKSLAIFLVTLPIIIGDSLFGIMAAYARVVSWETALDRNDSPERSSERPADEPRGDGEDDLDIPPDPTILFTVLYGIYPCNFTAFIKDAAGYLRDKSWQGPLNDGNLGINSAAVRERSQPIIRLHTLHPALFTSDLATELTDTTRWRRLEAADVMAACDRNVVELNLHRTHDWRGDATAAASPAATEQDLPLVAAEEEQEPAAWPPRELRQKRSALFFDHTASPPPPSGTITPGSPPSSITPHDLRSPSKKRTPASSISPSRISTPHMPAASHFANFQALQSSSSVYASSSMSPRRSGSRFRSPDSAAADPLAWSGVFDSHPYSHPVPSGTSMSRRSSAAPSLLSPELRPLSPSPTPAAPAAVVNGQIIKLETELVLLQGEVNFQTYLKQLHLQHMGTVHREKVLESGAEAERQSSFRTIRTLRAQLKATQSALDHLRAEQSATKANWIAHIADLREKLAALREQRMKWEHDERVLKAEVEDWKDRCGKRGKEAEEEGAAYLDLKNQVSIDEAKLSRIAEYEHRIEALARTLAICDEDLAKFVQQRKEMTMLVGEWKKSDLLREAVEEESNKLKEALRAKEAELAALSQTLPSQDSFSPSPLLVGSSTSKDELSRMRREMERLRRRNLELEEKLADTLEDERDDVLSNRGADEVERGV